MTTQMATGSSRDTGEETEIKTVVTENCMMIHYKRVYLKSKKDLLDVNKI